MQGMLKLLQQMGFESVFLIAKTINFVAVEAIVRFNPLQLQ
jgi:hypothetical protein